MRIISGKYKGKDILGYDIEGTRPTQDRVKESLFSMIQEDIRDSIVLDLFAGSGNLGIEAISNYASKAYLVDNNPKCIDILKKNLDKIPASQVEILKMDYRNALEEFQKNKQKFHIIFLDPPYSLNCLNEVLNKIIEYDILYKQGIIVCEYEHNCFSFEDSFLELEKERKYGYKNIRIYRKK